MMRSFVFILPLVFTACSTEQQFDPTPIQSILHQQEVAWDHGDIDGFMAGYTDDVCFMGRDENRCGKQAVTANYRKSYPDGKAMGDLEFDIWELTPAGNDHAWCSGAWTLFREADTLSGRFSLLWTKTPDGWLIERDHSDSN